MPNVKNIFDGEDYNNPTNNLDPVPELIAMIDGLARMAESGRLQQLCLVAVVDDPNTFSVICGDKCVGADMEIYGALNNLTHTYREQMLDREVYDYDDEE